MISQVKNLIDFVFNAIYNVILTYQQQGGIFFYITIGVFFVYPIFTRIIRSLRGSR